MAVGSSSQVRVAAQEKEFESLFSSQVEERADISISRSRYHKGTEKSPIPNENLSTSSK